MANDQWYTPPEYIESVRRVLGRIDLDPTSNELANSVVQAKRFITEEEDALSVSPWGDGVDTRVFMNPPYSKPKPFVDRIVSEWQEGAIAKAIILLNLSTSTQWWQQLWDFPICFCRKRIKFLKPEKKKVVPCCLSENFVLTLSNENEEDPEERYCFFCKDCGAENNRSVDIFTGNLIPGEAPRYANAFVYLPGLANEGRLPSSLFVREFSKYGRVIQAVKEPNEPF